MSVRSLKSSREHSAAMSTSLGERSQKSPWLLLELSNKHSEDFDFRKSLFFRIYE